MKGKGKSNAMAHTLQKCMNLANVKFILIDVEGVHKWQVKDPKRQIILHPKRGIDKQALLMKVLTKIMNEKYYILVVEGIDAFQTCHWMPEELKDFVNFGRNYEWGRSSYWVTFRRSADVHKDILGNIDHHFIFRNFEPNDVYNYYRRYLGKVVASKIQDLPDYHFYYWKVGKSPMLSSPVKKVI